MLGASIGVHPGLPAGDAPTEAWGPALRSNTIFFPLQLPTSHLCPPTGFSKNNLKNWHMVQGKRIRSRGLPGPWFMVSETCGHRPGRLPFLEAVTQPDPPGLCTVADRGHRSAGCTLQVAREAFSFSFVFASVACRLQKTSSES